MKTTLQALFGASLIMVLGACSSTTGTMSDAKFLAAEAEARAEYLASIQEEDRILSRKKETEYEVGRPVVYERDGIFRTVQWDRELGMIYIYPGKKTGMMSLDTHGVVVVRADSEGNIKYDADGRGGERPTTFLANVATEQGLGRVLLQGGFQVVSMGVNGALAAEIFSDGSCGNNCGNINLVNQGGVSSATSLAEGTGNASAGASAAVGCATGNCAAPPTN